MVLSSCLRTFTALLSCSARSDTFVLPRITVQAQAAVWFDVLRGLAFYPASTRGFLTETTYVPYQNCETAKPCASDFSLCSQPSIGGFPFFLRFRETAQT